MGGTGVQKKRPAWVWVISVFYVLSVLYGTLSWYLVLSGALPITSEVRAYMESLSTIEKIGGVIQGLITISGAITLFFLRKAAFYFFCAAFLMNLLGMVWQAVARGWLTAISSIKGGLAGALIGVGILLAVCIYTNKLVKRGTLT